MGLSLIEAFPFCLSSAFLLLGDPFSELPFRRLEVTLDEDLQRQIQLGEVPPTCADALLPDAIRRQAQEVAAYAALPREAALTALGFAFLMNKPWASVLPVLAIIVAALVQQRADMHRRFGPRLVRVTSAGIGLLILNALGLLLGIAG